MALRLFPNLVFAWCLKGSKLDLTKTALCDIPRDHHLPQGSLRWWSPVKYHHLHDWQWLHRQPVYQVFCPTLCFHHPQSWTSFRYTSCPMEKCYPGSILLTPSKPHLRRINYQKAIILYPISITKLGSIKCFLPCISIISFYKDTEEGAGRQVAE